MSILGILSDLVENVIPVVVMLVFEIPGFFVTVFVVSTGAYIAGYGQLSGDFVVLSASILVASTILGGLMK